MRHRVSELGEIGEGEENRVREERHEDREMRDGFDRVGRADDTRYHLRGVFQNARREVRPRGFKHVARHDLGVLEQEEHRERRGRVC